MSRRRTVLVLTGILSILVLAILWLFVAHIKMPEYTKRLEFRLSEALGMEVLVKGKSDLDILPKLRVSFSDVVLREEKLELLTIKRLSLGLEFLPLLRKRVRVTRLILEEPALTISAFNFTKVMGGKIDEGDPLLAGAVSVVEGVLRFKDEKTGREMKITGLDIEVNRLNRGKSGRLSFAAQIEARRLLFNTIEMKDLSATVDVEEGMCRAEPFRVNTFGGEVNGTFWMDARGEHPSFETKFTAGKISLGRLYRHFTGKEFLKGDVDVQAELSASGPGKIVENLNGKVNIAGTELILQGFNLDGFIKEFRKSRKLDLMDIGAYLFAGPVGALLTQSHDVAGMYRELKDGKSETLQEIAFDWKLKDGRAVTDDVAFRTKENRVAFQGTIDLSSRRYDGFILALLDKKGCAEITQEITGTLSEPKLKPPHLIHTLAGPLIDILQETMEAVDPEKCKPFYEGRVKHAR